MNLELEQKQQTQQWKLMGLSPRPAGRGALIGQLGHVIAPHSARVGTWQPPRIPGSEGVVSQRNQKEDNGNMCRTKKTTETGALADILPE